MFAKRFSFFFLNLWLFLPWSLGAFSVVPMPQHVKFLSDSCDIKGKIKVAALHSDLNFAAHYLSERVGGTVLRKYDANENALLIKLRIKKIKSIHPEAYEISISSKEIEVRGASKIGVFRGVNTLVQLLLTTRGEKASVLPNMLIQDQPKFQWRGMHLDVARHFFSVDFIKRYIDLLALYKMNVFHWHLTEDQGWRIEIKKYPKLTEIGAWRKGTMIGPYDDQKYDTISYGGFYTQEQIKEIVKYAADRHITVVPEIEMPGHALAALAAYPEFSCTGGPFQVAKGWGVFDDVFCVNDQTFQFIEDVLTEVLELFPSKYIHIGGDECPKARWKSCPKCQHTMQQNGLKDEHELQSYFIRRIEKFLNSKGRKLIGWDEILEGGLAPGAAVMSWRGTQGGIEAARMNHPVVMTPGSHCYFDHYQGNPKYEPLAFGGYTTLEKVYGFIPIPAELNQKEAQYILGAQGNVWTEYMKTEKQVEYMVLPRMLALSEVLWGTAEPEKYEQFIQRVEKHMKHIFGALGYNFSRSIYQINLNTVAISGVLYVRLHAPLIKQIYYDWIPEDSEIYALGGLGATKYAGHIPIRTSGMISYNHNFDGRLNETLGFVQEFIIHKATAKPIELLHQPHPNYSSGGAHSLVDGIQSDGRHFGSGWLGFSGTDLVANVDLMRDMPVQKLGINLLERKGSWIYYPQEVLFEASFDGQVYFPVANANQKQITAMNGKVRLDSSSSRPVRYVRVTAKNFGQIPDGMQGAGHKAWLFAEEIIVE
jgi:hexosaminidase